MQDVPPEFPADPSPDDERDDERDENDGEYGPGDDQNEAAGESSDAGEAAAAKSHDGTEHGEHDAILDGPVDGVPLFPLPNVVLMPGAVLPLHVFETRYRQMTEHLIADGRNGRRLIAIVRIGPGFDPMDDAPPVYDVGCCGRIIDAAKLDDGRYNILVKGLCRVEIGEEDEVGDDGPDGRPVLYRRAQLRPITSKKAFEIDLGEAREKMKSLCRRPPITGTPVGRQLEKLLAGPIPTAQLADVLAFDLLEDVDEKQSLLEQTDVRLRVERLAALLDEQFPEPDSIIKLSDRFNVDE